MFSMCSVNLTCITHVNFSCIGYETAMYIKLAYYNELTLKKCATKNGREIERDELRMDR